MDSRYEKILSYYEEFKLHKGTLFGKDGFFDFQPQSSLHSGITAFAYGIREKKSCLSLKDTNCKSIVVIDEDDISRRFYVKIKAQLFDWKKYVCGIDIFVNGARVYKNAEEFFENVNLGWPAIYIPVDCRFLKKGENVLELYQISGETHLLVSDIDLISLPAAVEGAQLTLKTAARINDEFALSFYVPYGEIAVDDEKGCIVSKISKSPINETHMIIKVKVFKKNPSLSVNINGKTVCVVMPEIFPESDDLCMVGTDSDDHRHDDSDETNRIIEIFANTNMGNFWQARPKRFRNYYVLSNEETWKRRIDYLKTYNNILSLSDDKNVMPYFAKHGAGRFIGKHFHEAYLYFCPAFIENDKLKNSDSFGNTKKLYCNVLRKMSLSCKNEKGLASVGSPSLLAVYEACNGFERVTIEPVSNINLLIGAVRGTITKMWGAHVPTDWYLGEPNDLTKAKKFLLAMQLLYIHGADYIYAENALFKANAFSREDWEDNFCKTCRKYLREFYEYTIKNPREGEFVNNLAVVYGNNEYFMWHYDNRIAELFENGDWDTVVWGKWKDNRHHKCWRAIDAWLPAASNQHSRNNIINLDLFSGTPYGSVDVIPYESSYSNYNAIVLLGWNTYEEGFAEKIYDYVKNGGTAFISYCHFNKTDKSGEPMEYASAEALGINCGKVVSIKGNTFFDGNKTVELNKEITIVLCRTDNAQEFVVDENGYVLVWKKKIGEGTLYFGTFADFNCPDGKLEIMKYVLNCIGEETADIICTNPNICFTERKSENGKITIDAINVCSNGENVEKYELIFRDGKKLAGEALPCRINRLECEKRV